MVIESKHPKYLSEILIFWECLAVFIKHGADLNVRMRF
jgi:hypothetical protein